MYSSFCSYLRCWIDGELKLGLLAVVHTQSFQEERSKSRSSATSEGVEHEESLETSALIG